MRMSAICCLFRVLADFLPGASQPRSALMRPNSDNSHTAGVIGYSSNILWQKGNVQYKPGPHLHIKTVFPRYGDSHVKDKMVCETEEIPLRAVIPMTSSKYTWVPLKTQVVYFKNYIKNTKEWMKLTQPTEWWRCGIQKILRLFYLKLQWNDNENR